MSRDEERAREIVDAPRWDNKNDLIHRIAQALARERAEENEACAKVGDKWHAVYPEDVFIPPPPGEHGQTVDACSARAARHTAKGIAEDIRARQTKT